MKMKDIQIGEEYAIGAPNTSSRYDSWHRIRGRVTRIGVHGTVSGSWYSHMSERATYVEFEVVEDPSAARCGYTYQHTIVQDRDGEHTPSRYTNKEKTVEVNRCLGSHVIMKWSDFVVALEEHEQDEVEAKRVVEQKEFEARDIRRRFKNLGLVAGGFRPYCFDFNTDDALVILDNLERFRGATTR